MNSPPPRLERSHGRTMLAGIGAQKAGTTWMHDYLSEHPEVWLSPIKELHVFDHRHVYDPATLLNRKARLANEIAQSEHKQSADAYDRLATSVIRAQMIDHLKKYMEYFAYRVNDESVFGEITPPYSLLPKAGYLEILSLHDPIRRAWSHINYQFERRHIKANDDEIYDPICEYCYAKFGTAVPPTWRSI